MHQPPTEQEQTLPFGHHHHILLLQETLVVTVLARKHSLAGFRNSTDLDPLVGASEDARFGLEGESADDLFFEVYGGETSEEGGANLGNDNPNKGFKPCTKCGREVEDQGGEDGGVTLSREDEEIEDGGVKKPYNELSREDGAIPFSQGLKYHKKNEDIYKGCAQVLEGDPANDDGGAKLFARNSYERHRHGQVALPTKYRYEDEGGGEGGVGLPVAPDDVRVSEDGGVNFFDGNPDKGITLSKGYGNGAQGQGEEGGGVCLFERYEGDGDQCSSIKPYQKHQSQFEGQDLDDGGVCLSEDQDVECGGVKLFNGPRSEGEDVRLSPEFEREKEDEGEVEGSIYILTENSETEVGGVKLFGEDEYEDYRSGCEHRQHAQIPLSITYEDEPADEYQDNFEFAQETDGGEDRDESEMNLPQQYKGANLPGAEGTTPFQEGFNAMPYLAYLKLLAHFLV